MACMDGAERLKNLKAAKEVLERTGQHTHDVDDAPPPQRSNQVLSTQLQKLSAEVDTHRAELVELLVQFDEQKGGRRLAHTIERNGPMTTSVSPKSVRMRI